jgi:hypothetical protein
VLADQFFHWHLEYYGAVVLSLHMIVERAKARGTPGPGHGILSPLSEGIAGAYLRRLGPRFAKLWKSEWRISRGVCRCRYSFCCLNSHHLLRLKLAPAPRPPSATECGPAAAVR